jgi:hypothetical protein
MFLEASEMYFAPRLGAETEHSRKLCEAFRNDAGARKTLAEPKGHS